MSAQSYILGQCRVRFDHLEFESGVRDYNEKNIARLRDIYKTEGCQREDPDHFVPVVINASVLGNDWQRSEQPTELVLPENFKIRCLHGKHRVLAAREVLSYRDQWWTVNLYDESIPQDVRRELIEEYTNELQFSDGDIFRFYRSAQNANKQRLVQKWQARLSTSKRRNLFQLEKADHGRIIESLDSLLPFVGLWQDFQLGALNRILPMHMWEEINHYLSRMLSIWQHIVGEIDPSTITPQTVGALQLHYPRISRSDYEALKTTLLEKSTGGSNFKLFPTIQGNDQRHRLVSRVLNSPRISSFHTFFEDTIYLEICHHSMRTIVNSREAYASSFETAFRRMFSGPEVRFPRRYTQTLLYAMRHFPDLSDIAASQPRKESRLSKPKRGVVKQSRLDAFANYTRSLGFNGIEKEDHIDHTDVAMAFRAPLTSTDIADVPFKARMNRPFERSFFVDRKHLFLEYVLLEPDTVDQQYITTFTVAREFICSFWDITSSMIETPPILASEPIVVDSATDGNRDNTSIAAQNDSGQNVQGSQATDRVDGEGIDSSVYDIQPEPVQCLESSEEVAVHPSDEVRAVISLARDQVAVSDQGTSLPGSSVQRKKRTRSISAANAPPSVSLLDGTLQQLESSDNWCVFDTLKNKVHIYSNTASEGLQAFDRMTENRSAGTFLKLHYREKVVARAVAWQALITSPSPKLLFISKWNGRPWDRIWVWINGKRSLLEWRLTGDSTSHEIVFSGDDITTQAFVYQGFLNFTKHDSSTSNEVHIGLSFEKGRVFEFSCLESDWTAFIADKEHQEEL